MSIPGRLLRSSPLLLVLSFATNTQAATITYSPGDPGVMAGACVLSEENCIYSDLALGANDGSFLLYYKANVGTEGAPATIEEGSFAGDYQTIFANDPLDPQDATISWIGPFWITCPQCILIIKDGESATPPYYWIDLGTWDGVETIALTGFWPTQGGISHVSIWGRTSDIPLEPIPEPATLLLLGTGLTIAAARLRRRRT